MEAERTAEASPQLPAIARAQRQYQWSSESGHSLLTKTRIPRFGVDIIIYGECGLLSPENVAFYFI